MRLSSPRKLAAALGGLLAVAGLAMPQGTAAASGSSIALAPYVDMGAWPSPVLSSMSEQSGIKSFTLGFVTGAACKASWFAAYDPRQGWQSDEIAKIRAAGGDVKVSFGGASGVELAQACSDVTSLAGEYEAVINAYHLKYIDVDIEGSAVADPASIALRSQALKKVQDDNPGLKISLTLPVLPTGLTSDGLNVVTSARDAGVDLDLVNVMAMDYYQGSGDQGAKAIQAAQSTQAQLKSALGLSDADAWRKVGLTPMLGVNDSQNEIFYQKDASAVVSFAQSVHLGMLSFWELGRDANACSGPLYRCTDVSQQPYEFSKIFAGYSG
ncbi:chitinase [Amycolatopsis echigonensis]|uniref:Chitinase n=1 Tax=Amycolatopsis echigonensis TaxID=2576905 RepID=A0A2N3WBU4_9PSEU|nr:MULTISPECIES: chitinase [Amycolatopsis]MBB2502907.1 sugar hydrolase [Amycolatopsis echigonensis]PKV91289.1 chitinase [Amycolatopsis niigatensis]